MNLPLAKQRTERERPFYQRLAWLLKGIAFLYLSVLGILMLSEGRLLFPGAGPDVGDWNHTDIELEEVEFASIDGTRLHGYFLPQPDSDRVILFCHGNAENIAILAPEMNRLRRDLQASVFVFDYRGYGRSQGVPFERGLLEDGMAAADWLSTRTGHDPATFIYIGRSLGGGVAVHLASEFGARLLILDRTFSSAVDVAASRYWWLPVRFVMRNQFLSIAKIKHYDGPLLQLHGDVDEVIPLWSAARLFTLAPTEKKEFVEIDGFTHYLPIPDSFHEKMAQWVDQTPIPSAVAQ